MRDPRMPLWGDLTRMIFVLGQVYPSMSACKWNASVSLSNRLPFPAMLGAIPKKHTRDFFLSIQIFIIPISKPVNGGHQPATESAGFSNRAPGRTYLSVPTNRPDFASPMYCSCRHHSLKPTRQKLRTVRASDTIRASLSTFPLSLLIKSQTEHLCYTAAWCCSLRSKWSGRRSCLPQQTS